MLNSGYRKKFLWRFGIYFVYARNLISHFKVTRNVYARYNLITMKYIEKYYVMYSIDT